MGSLLKKIENSTKFVSEKSKYVNINYSKIDEILKKENFEVVSHWLDSNPFGILDLECRDVINFLLVYHTFGLFCFWGEPKWEIDTEVGKLDGSIALLYLLFNRYKINKDFNMSMLTFSTLLDGNVEIPLLIERYESLKMMNKYLKELDDDFYNEIKSFKDDISLFNYIIENLDYFKDERDYKNEKIYFYKRAQLLVSDILHIREKLEGIEVDYSNLVGCADYKIPQVMNCLGILEYSSELEKIIENKMELKENSEMEIEIRANTLVVIDYIYKKLDGKVSKIHINDYIWLLGQDKNKICKYYHRTLTTSY